MFYLLTYGMATIGAFAILTVVRKGDGEADHLGYETEDRANDDRYDRGQDRFLGSRHSANLEPAIEAKP